MCSCVSARALAVTVVHYWVLTVSDFAVGFTGRGQVRFKYSSEIGNNRSFTHNHAKGTLRHSYSWLSSFHTCTSLKYIRCLECAFYFWLLLWNQENPPEKVLTAADLKQMEERLKKLNAKNNEDRYFCTRYVMSFVAHQLELRSRA